MATLSEAQKKWLQELTAVAGGGRAAPMLSDDSPAKELSPDDLGADPLGGQSVTMADGAKGTLKLPGGGKAAANAFVPDVEIAGGRKRELAVRGKLTLDVTVRNWAKRPNGTELNWSLSGSSKAVDFAFDRLDNGGTITVTGLEPGKGVVKVEVKVVGGGTFKLPELVFQVSPTAKNASMFVPELEMPHTLNRQIPLNVEVTLHLKIDNWKERPKGTRVGWGVNTTGNAVAIKTPFQIQNNGEDCIVTLKGREEGKAVMRTSVSVLDGGGTYAFRDTEFTVVKNTDPNSSMDMGGLADVTNVEQDMRNILQDWHSAARAGIGQFVTNALSKRIDQLESGSAKNFLFALVGNVVWAAAVFTPIGMTGTAFAISLTGIAIGAVPAIPEEKKSLIPTIQKAMEDYINGLIDPMDKSLRNKAKALLDTYPGITRFHAMNEFVAASFQAKFFTANAHHTSIPILNKAAIRDQYEGFAAIKLDEAIKADEARKAEKRKKDAAENRAQRSRRI